MRAPYELYWIINYFIKFEICQMEETKNGKQVSVIDKKAYVLVINNYLNWGYENVENKSKSCLSYSRMNMMIFAFAI